MSRILVIDDDSGNSLIIKSRLGDLGYEVVLADTGAGGLVEARNASMDLFMVAAGLGSGIDAVEVCRRLKALPETGSVPVLIFSGLPANPEELNRAYEAGCDAFVPKGEMAALDHIVRVQLRNKSIVEDLSEQNRALDQHNRRLREEGQRDADREQSRVRSGETSLVLRELAANRPDGVLVVDGEGFVRSADRGACEIFGNRIERKNLGYLAPASGLEAFVRDARYEPRDGFRFDINAIGGRAARTLTASVIPLLAEGGAGQGVLKIVLLLDAAKRRIAAEMLRVTEPGVPRQQLGAMLDAARELFCTQLLAGESECLKGAHAAIESFGRRRRPMLLQGDRGVGKTRVARTAHFAGPFSGPLMQVPCAATSEESLERELFGYVKGAFEDALIDRPGILHLAADGTVLLEDIGALTPRLQERVRDFLETGEVTRVGSERREKVELGLVASSVDSLEALVEAGQFDRGLLDQFRENTVSIEPLAERPEDIASLAALYVTHYGRPLGVRMIDEDAVEVLLNHTWRGNVRELEDCIREACQRAQEGAISLEHLPQSLLDECEGLPAHEVKPRPRGASIGGDSPMPAGVSASPRRRNPWDISEDDPISLDFYEKKALLRALDHVGGDKLAAARLLKVGKSTLYRKLKRFEIE